MTFITLRKCGKSKPILILDKGESKAGFEQFYSNNGRKTGWFIAMNISGELENPQPTIRIEVRNAE